MAKLPYQLVFAPEIRDHLHAIDAKYHALILQKIDEQLEFEPNVETRNRKPLRTSAAFSAEWEARFGPQNRFRVLYAVDDGRGRGSRTCDRRKTAKSPNDWRRGD